MSSLDPFITRMGGRAEVARIVGTTPNAVTNAKARGGFPWHWYPRLRDAAADRGLACPETLFAAPPVRKTG